MTVNSQNHIPTPATANTSAFPTWRTTLASDWKLMVIGALASFLLASLCMSGLPDGLIPDLSRPYGYEGDGMFHAWMAQRVLEGWVFDNVRSGYPFGSNFLDFPGSDAADHLLIKIFAIITGGWPGGVKLFYLLGFPTCFISTYITSRAFGLNRSFAITTSLLYTFIPFHFFRLNHLFYTWYFVVPLFFYLGLDIYLTRGPTIFSKEKSKIKKILLLALGMLILTSFGVYYALFGMIILASAGVMSFIKSRNTQGVKKTGLLIFGMAFGVLINISPNIVGTYRNGPNPEVAQRSYGQSEVLGLKMMQLLMPRPDHRIGRLASIGLHYNQTTPLINENSFAPLGIIGATGFMLALLYIIFIPPRTESDEKLRLLATITFILFLFATVGGLGTLFAILVSPSIRGWNRISIFIACGALLFFFISLQILLQKKAPRLANYTVIIAAALLFAGLYDQTAPPCKNCNASVKMSFDSDKDFVQSIEKALPPASAVYQLPYIGFPEEPIMNRLSNYQMMAGVLQSKELHWNFGGMKGRPGDLFYRALAQEPMERQIEVIRRLGFEGIYIDRRGYADSAESLIKELTQLLRQPPALQSNDKQLVFFNLQNSAHPILTGLSVKQIQRVAGYIADDQGPRYSSSLVNGIDFTRTGLPDFISDAQGLYGIEPWGRWSSQTAVFDFADPLPQKFSLILKALPYGPNAQKPIRVEIGNREYNIQLPAGISELHLDVDLQGSTAQRITFVPPTPITPNKINGSTDERVLGIGFVSMRIVQ